MLVDKRSDEVTYLENVSKLAGNIPITFAELVFPKLHIAISSNEVDSCDVLDCEIKHVEG